MKKDKIGHKINKCNEPVIRSPDNLGEKIKWDIKVINREELSRFP